MTKRILTILLAAVLALITSIACVSGGGFASANQDTVRLTVTVISSYHYYTGNEKDQNGGVELLIKCNKDTDELTYEYDDFKETKKIDLTDKLVIDESGTYKFVKIKVYKNGILSFKAVMDKGEDSEGEETEDIEIKSIDNKAPRLDKTKNPAPTKEGNKLHWLAFVTDDNASSFAANSGIKEIIVFCYDKTAEFDPTSPIESLDKILERKTVKIYNEYIRSATVEFTMDKNGLYIVYMKDNLGNFAYSTFGNYTDIPEYFVMVEISGALRRVDVNLATYEGYITKGKGKVSQDILDNLRKAIDDFVVTFQLERDMELKRTAYFALNNAVNAYNNAKINYNVAITNPEFLDGQLYPVNLENGLTSLLPGDTLKLAITVTYYNQQDIKRVYPQVLSMSNISSSDKIIRLSSSLSKNGSAIKPNTPLILQIEFPQNATVAIIASSDNNATYNVRKFVRDKDIIQFTSAESNEDLYFVVKYNSKSNNGLIIGLSVGGGVVLAAIIVVVVVLYKKGKFSKKKASISEEGVKDGESKNNSPQKVENRAREKKR